MVEVWTTGVGIPGIFARSATRAEEAGYDGITVVDSQNLSGDCYIALALAAKATTAIKLGTGVTNPFTRHPAVTASAIATVQAESGGRAVLGIGRGDSALAHLGFAPASVAMFEDYLRRVQGYLRGEDVPFDTTGDVDKLRLAERPTASRIEWLRPQQLKVPVDVAATGPKVLAVAGRQADHVTLAVGADSARLRWGIRTVREAREKAGVDQPIAVGTYVNVVVGEDRELARRIGEGSLSLFARFSAMHGKAVGPTTPEQRATLETIHDAYDMTHHARAGSQQASLLTPEFAEGFGIFGPASYCIDRLGEIVRLGVARLVIVGPSTGAERGSAGEAGAKFVSDVLPAVKRF